MLEKPKKIEDIVNLDGYAAVFIPGGHGCMVNLPACQPLGKLLNQAHVRDDPTLLGQWTLSEGAGDSCFDSSGKNCNGRLEGGVTRVQATRDFVPPAMTASERHIDSLYLQLRDFKLKFEKNEGRAMTKGDLHLAPPVISKIAKRLGML